MGIYYTNQTLEAFERLEKKGFLKGNEEFVLHDFLPAYQWMMKQMDKRLNRVGSFPVWLWTKKPNLLEEGHFTKGTKAVCLTVSRNGQKE